MIESVNKLKIYFEKNIIGAIIQIYDIGLKQTLWCAAPIDLIWLLCCYQHYGALHRLVFVD